MTIEIGIPDTARRSVADTLNHLLADEYVLFTKTRNYHWNVTGPQFSQLHTFFEEQYEKLDDFIDDIAERARSLGASAAGSLAEFTKLARVKEQPGQSLDAEGMIRQLLADHESLVRQLREDAVAVTDKHQDIGTGDFLTGLLEDHEKMAWMLRAYLTKTA